MKTKKGATLVGSLIAITILTSTLVVTLNLQVRVVRAKFFLQYDNTANLLMSEGLEIVRAIYNTNNSLPNGKYELDFNSTSLISVSTCTESSPNSTCDLLNPNNLRGYRMNLADTTTREFYRFVNISNTTTVPTVTSTVVVKNPRGGALKVYKATIKLYKID